LSVVAKGALLANPGKPLTAAEAAASLAYAIVAVEEGGLKKDFGNQGVLIVKPQLEGKEWEWPYRFEVSEGGDFLIVSNKVVVLVRKGGETLVSRLDGGSFADARFGLKPGILVVMTMQNLRDPVLQELNYEAKDVEFFKAKSSSEKPGEALGKSRYRLAKGGDGSYYAYSFDDGDLLGGSCQTSAKIKVVRFNAAMKVDLQGNDSDFIEHSLSDAPCRESTGLFMDEKLKDLVLLTKMGEQRLKVSECSVAPQ
jgi:hypothetical protein